jgi:group II intron reverse transcriptase/maturase
MRSITGSSTKAFGNETLDGITAKWFIETANSFRNGKFNFKPARRVYIPKPNGKSRPLTMPSPRDKVVQEAMRFLLELIYEPEFRNCSTGWRPNRGCSDAIKYINKKFAHDCWYIEGDIKAQFPTLNHERIVKVLSKKIKDQAFIDLIYKYLKVGYGSKTSEVKRMPLGVVQGGLISPILANIYMMEFDEWMEDVLIPNFNKGKRKKANPEYTRMIRKGKAVDKTIRTRIENDSNFKRMHYIRYADDFLIGIDGSYKDCVRIRKTVGDFLKKELLLDISMEKTKITNATKDSAQFLGYRIHKTKIRSMAVKRNSKGVVTRRPGRAVTDATTDRIIKRLIENGFAKKGGKPTRNGKFIYLNLFDLVEHYKMVERGILNYYGLAYNYGRVAARVDYILRYSCALTIASKMRLRTKKKVFSKYGYTLKIKSPDGKRSTSWPKISYSRPKKTKLTSAWIPERLVDNLSKRLKRGRGDLEGPCIKCGSMEKIEVHHVRKLKNINRKDYIGQLMARMNRKQIPLCQTCHIITHGGKVRNEHLEQRQYPGTRN